MAGCGVFSLFLSHRLFPPLFSLLRPVINALWQHCLHLEKLLIRRLMRGAADRWEHREWSGKFDMEDEGSNGRRSDFWQELFPSFLKLFIAHIVTQVLDFQREKSEPF